MFNTVGLIICALLAQNALAGDLIEDLQNAVKDPLGQLQKSQIIKVGARPFNHELNAQNRPKPGEFWIAIVGDSSTTGAAASPKFQATWNNLLGHVAEAIKNIHGEDLGPEEPLPAPLRVMYTTAEFDQASRAGHALQLNLQSDLAQKVDTEEYSFGYIIGRKFNLSPDSIVLAGQDGTRVSSMFKQFQRVLTTGPGTLPPLILVSYVANDLCDSSGFVDTVDRFRQSYKAELKKQFTQIATLPPDPQGTRIVIVAPLDIANVLTNVHLLSQKIRFEGNSELTCQQLRDGKVGGGDLSKAMQSNLIGQCPAILGATDRPEQRITRLRALQETQAGALNEAITEFNALGLKTRADYAGSTKEIDFQPGDLANDCFHPSRLGADRIAQQLLSHELSR